MRFDREKTRKEYGIIGSVHTSNVIRKGLIVDPMRTNIGEAFESINHSIFNSKLKSFGINGSCFLNCEASLSIKR